VNDTNRKVLDGSILEPVPPFRSVDELIAGERRRRRLRRGVAMIGAAAAITGLVFGVQAGLSNTPTVGPTLQPGQSGSGGTSMPTSPSRTVENTEARLVIALAEALSTVAPDYHAVLEPGKRIDSYPGYTGFTKNGSLTTSQGVGTIQLTVLWPLEGVPAPSNDELAGVSGCRGPLIHPSPMGTPVEQNCEVHGTLMGPVALAQQGDGVNHEYTVATSYSDRGMVAITARNNRASGLATPVLTLDQLRRIVTDPAMRP
jgi:hypothetical protein